MRCHTKFSCHGYLVPGISTPLHYTSMWGEGIVVHSSNAAVLKLHDLQDTLIG